MGELRKMNTNDPTPVPPDSEEEVAHLDDRVIGKAFAWSAIAFLMIALIAGGVFLYTTRKKASQPAKVTQLTAPSAAAAKPVDIPKVKFTDITAEAGIKFKHNNGAYGEKLLPETMGSGVAFFDFDNDGDQDLL